jgi:hypothetical protein
MIRYTFTALAAVLSTSALAQQSQSAPVTPQVPVVAVPAPAQSAAITARAVTSPTGNFTTLPANTELLLRLSQEVNSKRMKEGETFRVALAQDVMIGNFIVLPKGTPGTGYISYRTGKGAFGKSAKMEITMRSLDLPNGRTITLTGMTRQEGTGNTGATVGTAVAVGVFSAFVTGRSAIFAEGREVRGFTREALEVALPQ